MDLKTYRAAHGLTLDAFGAKLGVTGATVQRWEAGKVAPPLWRAIAIERATDGEVTTAELAAACATPKAA